MALNDSKIRAAKSLAKSYKLTDSQGLYLTVSTSGAKLWYFRYRLGGKDSRLAFGPYPQTTLAEAREKRHRESSAHPAGSEAPECVSGLYG